MNKSPAVTLIIIFLSLFSILKSQESDQHYNVTGSWLGRINVSSVQLRIVFNFSLNERDSLTVTLDSPDQGANGIKIGPVSISGNEITVKAPLLLAEYSGVIKNDTLIEGTFRQAGKDMKLDLSKQKTAFKLNRPQEPKPPFPYKQEDVKFFNEQAGITLAGTLTIPEGDGPFPAVILITGSGSQNRNEELMGHKPFMIIADYLSRRGIAVLRFDDRGVGQSQKSPVSPTSVDFATDADAAFNYLRTMPEIDPGEIGLAGHSEGGLIASISAAGNKDIAFVISMAGTGVSGEKILYKQNYDINKASGMDSKELKALLSMSRKLYAIIKKEPDNKKATDEMISIVKTSMEKQKASAEDIEKALKGFPASAATLTSPWYRAFIVTDPADYWKKVRCPVLAVNGTKDLQVNADMNLPAIKKALQSGGNKNAEIIKFPGLNHIFQHCTTGLPSEYGNIEETFAPEVLKTIADWINGL